MIDFHPCAAPCYRCKATAWECVGEFVPIKGKPYELVQCAFCGILLRVDPVPRHATDASEFRFQFGRFKGMTFAEAEAEPNGRRYLEHLRETNEKLRDRIEQYMGTASEI